MHTYLKQITEDSTNHFHFSDLVSVNKITLIHMIHLIAFISAMHLHRTSAKNCMTYHNRSASKTRDSHVVECVTQKLVVGCDRSKMRSLRGTLPSVSGTENVKARESFLRDVV